MLTYVYMCIVWFIYVRNMSFMRSFTQNTSEIETEERGGGGEGNTRTMQNREKIINLAE